MKERKKRKPSGAYYRRKSQRITKVAAFFKWLDITDFMGLSDDTKYSLLKAAKEYIQGDNAFDFWWKWGQQYYLDAVREEDKLAADETIEARAKGIAKKEWDDAPPIRDDEWVALVGAITIHLKRNEVYIDPDTNDETLFHFFYCFVPEEKRDAIFFKDMTGNGFVYSPDKALWEELEYKQILVHVHSLFQRYVGHERFRFSTPDVQKAWIHQMGYVHTYQGMLTILRGKQRVPHPFEAKLDAAEWLIPIGQNRVYCSNVGGVRDRKPEDLFTRAAPFDYCQQVLDDNKHVINNKDVRVGMMMKWKEKKIGPAEVLRNLRILFPNAMNLIEQSFKDEERLWFIVLRIGAMFSGYCTRESLFVYGKGKGGKSTLFQTILAVFGDLGIILGKLTFLKSKMDSAGQHNTDRMRAVRRRACLIDELESTDQMNESLIKNWVSHQILPAREIYGKQAEIRMKSSLTFLTNEPPRFSTEDITIRERLSAVRVTTKFFDENCPKNERPLNFTTVAEWKDGYSKQEDIYWIYRTKDSWNESLSFTKDEKKQSELGTLVCILTRIVYIMVHHHGCIQLPTPDKVAKDKLAFFSMGDVVDLFIGEYYERETDKKKAITLKECYKKFTDCWKEYGIKNMTLHTFKNNLNAKNLLLPLTSKKAVRVKLRLKDDVTQAAGLFVS